MSLFAGATKVVEHLISRKVSYSIGALIGSASTILVQHLSSPYKELVEVLSKALITMFP